MNPISSIAASPPVKPPDSSTPPKAPDPQNDNDADAGDAAQPPVVAALPPGQGTRINQLV